MSPASREQVEPAEDEVPQDAATAAPSFEVVGDASAEEMAVLTVVLAALGGGESDAAAAPSVGRWGAPGSGARQALHAGPGAWRASSRRG